MNTIPFDYSLIEKGYRVVTRDGREVTEVRLFTTLKDHLPLRAVVDGLLESFTTYGFELACKNPSVNDLVMIPPVVEKWMLILNYTFCYQFDELKNAKEALLKSLANKENAFIQKATYQNDRIISVELVNP